MQLELDIAQNYRNADPDTSKEAGRRVLSRDRFLALQIHAENPGGLTDFELGDLMKRQQTSAGKRRGELRDNGLIEDTGERRTAPSGARAIVWAVTQRGLDCLRSVTSE